MKITLSVKQPWPTKGEPDTGWVASDYDENTVIDVIAGPLFGHSTLVWDGGHRHAGKLQLRTGIMIDIDNDSTYVGEPVTKRQIVQALAELRCSYILCPSKSHLKEKDATATKPAQAAVERWHVYLPFAENVPSTPGLEKAVENMIVRHFGALGADPIFDGGRYFSPGKAPELVTVYDGTPIQPNWLIGHYGMGDDGLKYRKEVAHKRRESRGEHVSHDSKQVGRKGAEKGGEYWRKKQEVTLADNSTVLASEIDCHTPCRCINPSHLDEHASAFVSFNNDGLQFIHCKSCNLTWWEKDWMQVYLDRLFYVDSELHAFYGSDDVSWDIGKFPQNGIISPTPEAKTGLLAILAKTPLCRAKLVISREKGGMLPASARKDAERSVLHMVEPMSPDGPQDVQAVDAWFHMLFGPHAEFLMNWVSIYAFGNFDRLPVIVLNGPRGSGKSGFAELVGDLYPSRSRRWDADKTGFNDELDAFLVHVDELQAAEHGRTENKAFYRLLKSITGSLRLAINRKYGLKYEVKNNLSIIITTNDLDPIHLDPFERATDPANNQFFVYTMPQAVTIDLVKWRHVQACFPAWVRTAGLARYNAWNNGPERHRARYSLLVPITEQEEAAYEESKTEIERLAPALWVAMKDKRYGGMSLATNPEKGYFTAADFALLSDAIRNSHSGLHLGKTFRRFGWLETAATKHRAGQVIVSGYRPTDAGRAIWDSHNV